MYNLYPVYPGGLKKALTFSYDDGNDCDMILTDLFRRYKVKGTFNVNSFMFLPEERPLGDKLFQRMTLDQARKAYGDDMEIAVHGATHPWWNRVTSEYMLRDILYDKRAIEQIFGRICRGAACPEGTYDDDTLSALTLCGFRYCRSTGVTHSLELDWNAPLLGFKSTTRHRDPELMDLGNEFVSRKVTDHRLLLFYVYGHSYEFVKQNNWYVMEDFLKLVSGQKDVWYATNLEIFDYIAAVKALSWSADRDRVMNPTSQDIWLEQKTDGNPRLYRVAPGETLHIEKGGPRS